MNAGPSPLRDAYPTIPANVLNRGNEEFSQKMMALRTRLLRANRGCNGAHCYPLHRLVEHLGVSLDFNFGQTEERYGRVSA